MISAGNVCRVCLTIDAPVRDIAGSPLQDIYVKLTEISLSTLHQPVAVCYLCCSQLRKCWDLMTRSVRANKVLAQILQISKITEDEFVAIVKLYQVGDGLSKTPIELDSFTGTEPTWMTEETKEKPLTSQCRGEMETDRVPLKDRFKFEDSEHDAAIERAVLDDMYYTESEKLVDERSVKEKAPERDIDVEMQELIAVDDIKLETEGIKDFDIEELIAEENKMLEELEEAQGVEYKNLEGPAPVEECKETQVDNIQDGSAMTSDGEKPFECKICKAKFDDQNNLKKHLMAHTGEKILESDICTFSQKDSLKTHTITHTDQKLFQCDICKARFTKKGSLKIHVMTHTDQKLFQCDICKTRFTQKGSLKIHEMTHTDQKPFQCEICRVRFTKKGSLKIHAMTHTDRKRFQCEICKVRFTKKGSLKIHAMTHTDRKRFQCEICKVRFTKKGSLKIHAMTHTDQKLFQCDICKARFTKKGSLKIHAMTHTDQKPFQCDICKTRFTQMGSLKIHEMTHTDQKPFQCEICKARFSQSASLKTHTMTHTDENPFQCKICKSRFSQKSNLKRHSRAHTVQKPYECQVCKVRFSFEDTLKKHSLIHTGVVSP